MTEIPAARRSLAGFAQSVLSLRWLVLAAMIALEAVEPPRTSIDIALPFYVGILVYSLALTLYAWRFPTRAEAAARVAVPFDLAAVLIGMQFTSHSREFFVLGFAVCAMAGLVLGRLGAAVVAAAVTLGQVPGLPGSLFAPDRYLSWGIAALGLLFTSSAAAVIWATREIRTDSALTTFDAAVAAGRPDALDVALESLLGDLRADSGSIMVFDPEASRLEIVAARGLSDAHRHERPRLGEGIAGWVLQETRPLLLTPDASIPFSLSRQEIGSSLCLPLVIGARPLGVLNLNRAAGKPLFTPADLDRAGAMARHLRASLVEAQHERVFSAALSHLAAGQHEVGRALSRDPAVLWPVLLDVARTLTAARFAVLALERDDTGTIDIVSARGIDAPGAKRLLPDLLTASTQGKLHAVDGPTATVCVPLRVQDRTIGAIAVGGLPANGSVPRSLLSAVAAHVAATVHTARTAYRIADIGVIEERRRIAREMHDGLAQTLADALLQTDLTAMASQSNPAQTGGDLKELRTVLERAMRELREFMMEMRREQEADSGLRASLESMGKEFERRNAIPVQVVFTGDDAQLPSAVRHAVLAIARQALTNVRAHAHATAVTIRGGMTDQECVASFTDDGVGFDLAAYRSRPPAAHHLGLTSMEERAALVGGRLQIDTASGRGTTVSVRVPLGTS
ncbi:MAG: GAF domain-containing sensor histidine kinase [Armatimonadetes bacterium]|nr:GAF domain-containing sensor histidine kinase [Armatimonadota bacterium]